MATQFSQLFWGLLIVIFDFSINGFDLLIDGVGYLIVAAGCFGLSSLSSQFVTARILCFVLVVLWLIGFAVPDDTASDALYTLVSTIVDCAMICKLLGGIREFALSRQRQDLAKQAGDRRLAYIAIMLSTPLIAFAALLVDPGLFIITIVFAVVALLILLIMILHLIHRVKVELTT